MPSVSRYASDVHVDTYIFLTFGEHVHTIASSGSGFA
jgi:hypothetical protein